MTELKENTIIMIKKLSECLGGTDFFINRFTIDTAGNGRQIIDFEIREKEVEE